MLHAVNGGGQNQARAILTGALVGTQTGLSDIPWRFLDGLEEGETLVQFALDLVAQVSAVSGP
ncbi:ADP-ribosylglycohydrolase family protein [Nitrosospira multiformis]|uniref:ADP-ribosylglycohydrolase family protein n=1 Tax=Nitrosospira multiformis TaxID=1231 RepID=UPI00094375B3|nr:ADP-ribosylglycohydrolase family protein [Nitrosospira multiformis]